MHRSLLCLAISAALLAPGCCLPQLSGRCAQATPSAPSGECALCTGGQADGHARHGVHRGDGNRHKLEHGLLAGHFSGQATPLGEVVPLPRFHPVPTHPVFEPLPEYGLPRSLSSPATLPPAESPHEPLPTPAQPIPDPA